MAETQVPGTSASEAAPDEGAELEVFGEPGFTIGPPQAVTDPGQLPAVTAEEEADFVSRANRGAEHPDNVAVDAIAEADDDVVAEAPQPLGLVAGVDDDDEDLPGEDELDALVADVDEDDIDDVGFDDDDLDEPLEIDLTDSADEPSGRGES